MFPDLHKFPYLSYDTETTGLKYRADKVFGFSLSTPDGKDYYYDIRETPKAVDWINDELRHYDGIKIMHNASFDVKMSDYTGIHIPLVNCQDTVIIACQINEHLFSYQLDDLLKKYMGMEKDTTIYQKMADLFGGLPTRNVQIGRIHKAPSEVVAPYAKMDTRGTLALWEWQQEEIERQGIQQIVEFELSLMPTFIRNEMKGIRVDLDYAEKAMDKLTPLIEKEQKTLDEWAGSNINVNSSPQIKKMFSPVEVSDGVWETKDGVAIGTTPKGGPSINADVLREMNHPAAKCILELRSTMKMRDTFLGKHVLEHAIKDRVYPSINQSKGDEGVGTGTGRLSYNDPAMQQIPSRNKEKAAIIKPAFLPDVGQVWVDGDMASFEVRVFAHLVNNPEIIAAFKENSDLDFHEFVASLTGLVRNATYSGQPNAKQLNLSMIFNSGNGAIADKMGMEWAWDEFTAKDGKLIRYKKAGKEALEVINRYHQRIPGIKELANGCKKVAEDRGFIFTKTAGRRLRFPRGYKSYKASGLLIQATSADLNKENWKIIEEELGEEGRLILNTHDSYSMSLPEDWKPYYNRVKRRIEEEGRVRVPLKLDWNGAGRNWHEALQKVDNTRG